ncbi:unnamed protein product [Durusdinium trenchii]|uniref:Uncharacterized protein n=1 Tax=Durusdinium trenchii TaxID=1381693 RepID=A0ABP0P0C1_9DINO
MATDPLSDLRIASCRGVEVDDSEVKRQTNCASGFNDKCQFASGGSIFNFHDSAHVEITITSHVHFHGRPHPSPSVPAGDCRDSSPSDCRDHRIKDKSKKKHKRRKAKKFDKGEFDSPASDSDRGGDHGGSDDRKRTRVHVKSGGGTKTPDRRVSPCGRSAGEAPCLQCEDTQGMANQESPPSLGKAITMQPGWDACVRAACRETQNESWPSDGLESQVRGLVKGFVDSIFAAHSHRTNHCDS